MGSKQYIIEKYSIDDHGEKFIEIPNMNREDLAVLFSELNFMTGAEVGVKQGVYSEILCKANPNINLYSIDGWEVYVDSIYGSEEDLNSWYSETKEKLSIYPNSRVVKGFSMDVVKTFEDNSLDFVYIDANHRYKFIYEDLTEWAKKVKIGGIISGHDFLFSHNCKVSKAIDHYTKSKNIRPIYIIGRGEKKRNEKRDASRSWFWIKENTYD